MVDCVRGPTFTVPHSCEMGLSVQPTASLSESWQSSSLTHLDP
jgi:hypothetical protein